MRASFFFRELFTQFPHLIVCNTLILLFIGVIDAASVLSLAPVVDLLTNPTAQNISAITKHIMSFMKKWGIDTTIGTMLFIFFLFNLLRGLLTIFSRYYIQKMKYKVLRVIHMGTFEDIFSARWYFFTTNKQGVLLNTFLREMVYVGDSFGQIANFFSQVIQGILFLVVPLFISWQVTLISLVCGLLFALPFMLFGKISYSLGKMNTATSNKIFSVIHESLSSAKIILGFGNTKTASRSLAGAFDDHARVTIKSQTLSTAISNLYYPLGIAILIITILSGQRFDVSLSGITIILYSFIKIIPVFGGITASINSLDNLFPSYEQIMEIRKNARALKQQTGNRLFNGFAKEIRLSKVSFSYPHHETILQEVNINIPKGKMIALIGESGAGKSTLIDIIMGFNEPLSGQITIDEVPLHEFDVSSYRKRIGYVPQDNILFNMSIRDNLLWAREDATEEDIKRACVQAYATEFIESFPNGFNTLVGDRGVRLSGGQQQRIALARALLRNPDILILDEATSSLDSQSEHLIQKAVEDIAKKTTVIVIAHRLSTIIKSNYIYVLERGRIIEEGTYTDLLLKNGKFQQMLSLQSIISSNNEGIGNNLEFTNKT